VFRKNSWRTFFLCSGKMHGAPSSCN
jgi:hypothetical protein